MGIINVLDFHVANLIAAGEVVERPASVVKELLENAVDAGAKKITVEIKHGGVSYIRVADDGRGMSREDLNVCIKRHATSKIKDASDLDGIITLGFRGEALAAISAVSKMRIMTKRHDDEYGNILYAESGNVTDISETGCPDGTTVIVEELFANVPARRKFLKKDVSEGMAVSAVTEKIALSSPNVSIRLITDGNVRFSTAGDGNLGNAIYSVLGREFSSHMIPVRSMTDGIEIIGYIGTPDFVRSNRNFQNYFINGRYVKSRTAMAAVEQAYDSFIPQDKFPSCVLMISIHPTFVDVNVHPTKLEVKFSDERIVFDSIYGSVRNTLMQSQKRPEYQVNHGSVSIEEIKTMGAFIPVYDRSANDTPKSRMEQLHISDREEQIQYSIPIKNTPDIIPDVNQSVKPSVQENNQFREVNCHSQDTTVVENIQSNDTQNDTDESIVQNHYQENQYRIIGEAFHSYIMVEHEDKVLLIDKHAAHERIIFEQMKKNMRASVRQSQTLLIPLTAKLSTQEAGALEDYREEIEKTGYIYSITDNCNVTITAYPAEIEQDAAVDMLTEMAHNIVSGTGTAELTREIIYEKALYQGSCKAAIKAGQMNPAGHIEWLCRKLFELPDIKYCPHGRPVAIELTKTEVEKQFKRR